MSDQSNPPRGSVPPAPVAPVGPQKLPSGVHQMRRGGARREVSERVTFRTEDGRALDGWALNVSRGGLRAIVEEKVLLGQKLDIAMGLDTDAIQRTGRIVWVQEEPDGAIVGIEFTGLSDTHKSVPPAPPGSQREPHVAVEGEGDGQG